MIDRTSMVNTTVGASAIVPEVLNWDNYEHWSVRVKTYLLAEGLWNVVEATTSELEHDEDWSRENARALHAIHISCGPDVFQLISDTDRAKVAWDKLKETFVLYQGNTENRIESIDGGHDVEATDGYGAFFKDLASENWNAVKKFLNRNPDAVSKGDPNYYNFTALHRVARDVRDLQLVEEMMQYVMKEEDLETKDWCDQIPLCYAVRNGIKETAECMIRKNKRLVTSAFFYPPNLQVKPVVSAAWYSKWEMTKYLYSVTPIEALNDANGATLIGTCIAQKKFDIAWDLLQHYPNLATTKDFLDDFPINILAGIRSAFLSGTPLSFWQRWIYESIHNDFTIPGTFRNVGNDEKNQRDFICSGKFHRQTRGQENLSFWHHISSNCKSIRGSFQGLLMSLLKLLGIFDSIYEIKLIHAQALQFLHCMAEVVVDQHKTKLHDSVVQRAIFRAVERGHFEFVKALVARNKSITEMYDKRTRRLFHFAIECRQEKVFNLIYETEYKGCIEKISRATDGLENGLLHAVGNISPSAQFNHIRDAALQMQRELQWFKEVESLVPSELHEKLNLVNKMTGRELFTMNHKELVKEGEKSMKETATSCIIVGALIVTIMFAASFTVAGGNNSNTGLPMFLDDKLFVVFIVSDGLSLFSSTTSVMIFLGILTSRYAEDDFLISLPRKMMVGLLTLFFSIATMMISFSSTLIIMLYNKYSWIVVPIILLACIPITSFVWMQFPLLVEISISTYGPGIFAKKPQVELKRSRLRGFYTRMKARTFTHPTLKSIV